VKTREWHIDQTHNDSPEYKRNPASERENGSYYLTLIPTLNAWDGTSAGTGVFLDDTEKQASGATIQLGQTEGTTGFTVGGQSHLPGEEYKITWDNTDFQIIDQQTGETVHGDLTINEDNWFHSFAIVAGPHAAPGEQVHITLEAMLNGQVFSTDQLLAKITDDPHFNHYTLPIDDASGPKYRKIALNGRPMADEKPQHTEESDQEKEESFIDAMTLGLRHSVTDIFVPIAGSDLVLSARRDVSSTVWNMKGGFRPHEHIDWPFGPGWTSSLAPKVDIVAAPGQPVYAYLTDEHGSSHRFIQYVGAGGIQFVPSPSSRTENRSVRSSDSTRTEIGAPPACLRALFTDSRQQK